MATTIKLLYCRLIRYRYRRRLSRVALGLRLLGGLIAIYSQLRD